MSVLALLVASAPNVGAAESLAGSKGDSRFPVYFAPGTIGGCGKNYKDYVAAGGHSAYAMTPFNWATEFTICGLSECNIPEGCGGAGVEILPVRAQQVQGHDCRGLRHSCLQIDRHSSAFDIFNGWEK